MARNILNALPELINNGVLTEEAAGRVRAYYLQQEQQQPQRTNLIFGMLGAILVGLGIILMVAHNWDTLPNSIKLFFSFIPLVAGQVLCGYTLFKKADNRTCRETSASFLFFAVGASIALVAQVYHIPGNLASFLLTWMLLSFPIIYIMSSSMVSLLYMVGITAFGVEEGYGYQAADDHYYWGLLLLAVPFYIQLVKKQPAGNATFFHHWFVAISLTICLGTVASSGARLMPIAYMSLFAMFYLLATMPWFGFKRLLSNGYLVVGSLGTMILLLGLSFEFFWVELAAGTFRSGFPEMLATALFTLAAIILLYLQVRDRREAPLNPMSFVFLLFIVIYFIGLQAPIAGVVLMNLLVLAAAVFTIMRGLRLQHIGILNYGLLIIAVLVICRFFDTNISFVLRGLMFVAVGVGFFIANTRLAKKRKQHVQ